MTLLKNQQVRDSFKLMRCLVCNRTPCDPCHIHTYGRTREDDPNNIMPLCRKHHNEQGTGIVTFVKKYPAVMAYVTARGFYINAYNKLVKDLKFDDMK